jgi:hypothetical protein
MEALNDVYPVLLEKHTIEKLETFAQKMGRYPRPLRDWVGVTDEWYNSHHYVRHKDVRRAGVDELIVCCLAIFRRDGFHPRADFFDWNTWVSEVHNLQIRVQCFLSFIARDV